MLKVSLGYTDSVTTTKGQKSYCKFLTAGLASSFHTENFPWYFNCNCVKCSGIGG